jgi:2,5-furandicarboxylate decarboxylase 1
MPSLNEFLAEHRSEIFAIDKPVPLDHVGALTGQAERTIWFEEIEGYPDWSIVDQLFVDRDAQARVLGCDPGEVNQRMAAALREGPKPLKEVDDSPCQEVVLEGDEIDLSRLPIVTHTDLDPYPYTTGFVIHRDPGSGQFNLMFPRCGVLDRNEMVASFVTPTANQFLAQHREAGTKMPQAQVIGVHPAWEAAGVYSHPHRTWWEPELFETLTGQPGEMVRCKTVDLMVPADANLVIEGYVLPDRTAQDGPSPGPTMLFTPWASQQPVFEVTAITMRSGPRIYRNHQMTPWTDHQELPRLYHEAIIWEKLHAMGIQPRTVHFNQAGGSLMCVIQVEPRFDGHVKDALLSVMGSTWLNVKFVVAVDPDIDPFDTREVLYAMATRANPSRDVVIVDGCRAFPFDPSADVIEEAFDHSKDTRFPSVVGKWAVDATKPVGYRAERRAEFDRAWPMHWDDVRLEDYL